MNDVSRAIVTSVSHGYTETLIKNGLLPEWIPDPDADAKIIYEAAVDLHRQKKPINPLALMVKCGGKLANAAEIKTLLSLNGTGDVDPQEVVRRARDIHLEGEARKLHSKVSELLAKRPTEISQWLPVMSQRFQSLTMQSRAYDPRPSAHAGPIVPPVLFKSLLPTYNEMMLGKADDGGGYRSYWYSVYIGITGRGKTTTAYTIGWDGLKQYRRITFVSKENESQVSARILLALTHLTLDEINRRKATQQSPMFDQFGAPYLIKDTEGSVIGEWHEEKTRQHVLDTWCAALDIYLRIYNWKYFGAENLRNVISWDNPDILVVDYVGPEDVPARIDTKTGLGTISSTLEEIAHTTGKHIVSTWQMANSEARAYEKNSQHIVQGPYMSGAVVHSADAVYQTKKDNNPNTQHYLRTKDRAGGNIEEFQMGYDPRRWVYMEMPEPPEIRVVNI